MPRVRAAIFDAYGTLLDVNAATQRHAGWIGPNWQAISTDWRRKQIEYTWVRTLAGPAQHRDFWRLTQDALTWAAAKHGVANAALLEDVLQAYRRLNPYPEVSTVLRRVKEMGIARAVLSNGEPSMLADAVRHANLENLLDAVLSVESARVFKPEPRVYWLAVERFGAPASEMAFISSNPWDAYGACCAGFQVFWINRDRLPNEYDLQARATELPNLSGLPDHLA
ncbi:MAG: haloacid dehalogenase type II [Acetobacteraceae bacterium]|nr:haloacid dehalogenase type II [Acetobacteraceae bacterium]